MFLSAGSIWIESIMVGDERCSDRCNHQLEPAPSFRSAVRFGSETNDLSYPWQQPNNNNSDNYTFVIISIMRSLTTKINNNTGRINCGSTRGLALNDASIGLPANYERFTVLFTGQLAGHLHVFIQADYLLLKMCVWIHSIRTRPLIVYY